jgi:hypothetical protein
MPFLISFDSLRIRHIRTYYLTNDTISIWYKSDVK